MPRYAKKRYSKKRAKPKLTKRAKKAVRRAVVKTQIELKSRETLDGNEMPFQTVVAGSDPVEYEGGAPYHLILPQSYNKWLGTTYGRGGTSQGTASGEYIGDQVTPMYLRAKLRLTFPQNENSLPNDMNLKVFWGWTTPSNFQRLSDGINPASYAVPWSNIYARASSKVALDFQKNDLLTFRKLDRTQYSIIGSKTVKLDRNAQIGQQGIAASTINSVGGPPNWMCSIEWKLPKKKIVLTKTVDQDQDPDVQYSFPNVDKMPYILIFNPNYEAMNKPIAVGSSTLTGVINWEMADKLWYTDA